MIARGDVEWELARRLLAGTREAVRGLTMEEEAPYIRLDPHAGAYSLGPNEQFWGGFMLGRGWLLANLFDDQELTDALRDRARHVAALMDIPNVDTGFAGYYGLALGAEVTGDSVLREAATRGAASVAELFDPSVGVVLTLTRAPDARLADLAFAEVFCRRELLVDTAAILDLNWWAAGERREDVPMLVSHADRTIALGLVEPDGRGHHAIDFAADDAPRRLHTHQGIGADTRWSRATAWAAVGFATAYAATGDRRYAEVSLASVRYLVDAIGDGVVPLFDLDAPAGSPEDSCSTAIILAAAERLRDAGVDLPDEVESYLNRAYRELLERYVTPGGTLLHGCWGSIGDRLTESVMPYGNYFLAEALYRRLGGRDVWGIRNVTEEAHA